MKNVMVKISRGTSYNRANNAASASGATDDITLRNVMTSGLATSLLDTSAKYLYVETDELGQVTFTLAQDSTTGLKTTISAATMDGSNLTDSKDAVFTVITSPDTDKAIYWGHMPETATNSAGVEFRHPLLAAEMTSNSGTYLDNNETWPLVTIANTQKAGATGCDAQYQPLLNDLQTLYDDNPNSAIDTAFGWPVGAGKSWLAVDQETGTGYYQYLRLDTGAKGRSSSTSVTGAQVCLVEPHTSTPASITLTSTAMDGAKNAAVVEKGSAMPLTVTVKDSNQR